MSKPKLSTNWDALVTSAPANTQAAKDAAAKGTGWKPGRQIVHEHDVHSDCPPPMRAVPPNSPALVGMKVGKLTIVGLHAKSGLNGGRWVVRCVCGQYETRRAKVLRDAVYASRACCKVCDYTREMIAGRTPALMPKIDVKTGRPVTLTTEPKEKGCEFVADPHTPIATMVLTNLEGG